MLSREALQQLFDLKPPFPGLQSEVGGDHLKPFPIKPRAVYPLEQAKDAYVAVAGSSRDRVILQPR